MSETLITNRFLGFLIWESIQSSAIFILSKSLLFSPFTTTPFLPSFLSILTLFFFIISMLIFSVSLQLIASPRSQRGAKPLDLVLGLVRLVFTGSVTDSSDFVCKARVSVGIVLFVLGSGFSGLVGVVSLALSSCSESFGGLVGNLGFRGLVMGLLYGFYCVFYQRSALVFPVVQRLPFFSYKMGLRSAVRRALQLSMVVFWFSLILVSIVLDRLTNQVTTGYFAAHFVFYIASFVVILSWELILHLHRVLHTKRFAFAPPKGSAAAETNPSKPLLAALEESSSGSLVQYLAYLDLSIVCASNVDPWRRAAFFEETGETYKRVVDVCLKPLNQLASKLGEELSSSAENTVKLSSQLYAPDEIHRKPEILDLFSDFQLYAWCAEAVASLEVRSHKEDRFGIAQLSGSHATVLSTLLSCLLAVETFMGKKVNLQSPNHMFGSAGIKWATNSTAQRGVATAMNKQRGSPSYLKSYALADVLKLSIYSVVSEFHEEMLASAKLGHLEKDWVSNNGKPSYGSVELLAQKLHFFLNFQA